METKGNKTEFIDDTNNFKRTILIERLDRYYYNEDEDIRYFQDRLFRALRIPYQYVDYEV